MSAGVGLCCTYCDKTLKRSISPGLERRAVCFGLSSSLACARAPLSLSSCRLGTETFTRVWSVVPCFHNSSVFTRSHPVRMYTCTERLDSRYTIMFQLEATDG